MDNAILRSTTDEMLSKLLTIDGAKELLAPTEGLAEYEFDTNGVNNKINFTFPDNWNAGLKDMDDFAVTEATIDIDGTEIPLTKAGALDLISTVSFSKPAVLDTPGNIVQDYVNYHYSHGARNQTNLKLLASDVGALAITRGTVQPFSSSSLLDAIVDGIADRGYGTDDLRVDYKWNHSLQLTNLRVIIPSSMRNIGSARAASAGDDPWSLGIELTNSITGDKALELNGNLFAWFCTNGMTIERASSGRYRRKPTLSPDDAYEWARVMVSDVFDDLQGEFERIEHLTQIPLEGELNETVGSVFEQYGVPNTARERIMANLVDSTDLSAYGLVNAITAAANDEEISPSEVNSLLRIGGNVAAAFDDRCPACHKF